MKNNTYTTQDGKTARLVNPYDEYEICEDTDRVINNEDWDTFERNYPPIPLTTERPDLIGKEFEGEVVEQGSDDQINWYCEDLGYYKYFRQALSVPVKGEEKPYSYEEAKKRNEKFKPIARRYETGKIGFYDALHEAYTHATNDANLVPLDKVVSMIERYAMPGNDYVIEDLITQIKNLTNE